MDVYHLWEIDEAGGRSCALQVESTELREVWAYARTLLRNCMAVEVWRGSEFLQTVRSSTLH